MQLASSAVPCDESMAVALAGNPTPPADPVQEVLNLLAGLLQVLFGLV